MSQTHADLGHQPFDLTEVQESFYAGRLAAAGSGNQIHLEFEVEQLDPDALRASWNRLVAATGMLRAHLSPDARQVIEAEAPDYPITVVDLGEATDDQRRAALDRMRAEAAGGIDPHRWPLFDVRAATLPGGRGRVMLTVDELIADGPSVSLLLQHWYAGYRFGAEPPRPGISFPDYARAVSATPPSAASLTYWRDKLATVDLDRPLPLARPHPVDTDDTHRRLVFRLEAEPWRRARDAAARSRTTASALLLALCAAAVQTEAVRPGTLPVVLTTYNRRPIHPDVPRVVGPFLSTSVFVAPEPVGRLGELLDQVRGQLWRDLEHADVSGVRAVREHARATARRQVTPIRTVFTSLLGSITAQRDEPDNWAALVDLAASATRTPGVQLEMCVQERAGALLVSWDYQPQALDETRVRAAFARLEATLHRIARLGVAAWDGPVVDPEQAPGGLSAPASADQPQRFPLTEIQSAYLVGRMGDLRGQAETRVYQEFLLERYDMDALETAWNRLVVHHPLLRATVHEDGSLEIAPDVPHYRIARHDLTGLDAGGRSGTPGGEASTAVARALAGTAARLRATSLPLGSRPMYALEASALPDGTHVLHVVLDALLADARSFALLFGQLFALHDGHHTLLDATADPRPYLRGLVAPRVGAEVEAARDEWRRKFAALPSGPALPEPAPAAERLHRRAGLGSWQALSERAAAIGVPADMILFTAFTDELRHAMDGGPFTVTVVSWDRPTDLPHADRMVADFTQLAWVVVDDDLPVDFAARARELWSRTRADLERGRRVPGFAELRGRLLRATARLRLPVVFTRVPEIDPDLRPRGVKLRESQSQTAQVALDHVPLLVGDELVVQWDVARDCVEPRRLDTLFQGYVARLREATGDPGPDGPPTMTELLAESLLRHADRPAVRWRGRTVSYRELDHRSARLAHRLVRSGVRRGDHVAVHLDRSDELVVALVGIVRAGAVWVPVEPVNPPDRVRYLLADSGARMVVTDATRAAVPAAAGVPTLCPDREEDRALLEACPDTIGQVGVGPDDPVYMIYTSGTTGRPKGCRNTHRGLANRLRWMQERFPLSTEDRVAQKTPYGFDVSVWEFFWPLLVGASIVVARPGGHGDPGYLARLFRDERVTVSHFVPSMLGLFLRDPGAGACDTVRYVFASGEALPVSTMRRFFDVLPGAELHNLYGPTETAIDVTHWRCRPDWAEATVPIGRPITNTRIHLVDEGLRRVPDGEPGEIVIGGWPVALGYHERPELTAERFVPSPFADDPSPRLYRTGDLARLGPDGELRYLGRLDDQFKLRGLRIEPAEVEAALVETGCVAEARVLPLTDAATGEPTLAAVCVVADGGAAPSVPELRRALADILPDHLVPSGFRFVERLPLTPNGKVDRAVAVGLFADRPDLAGTVAVGVDDSPPAASAGLDDPPPAAARDAAPVTPDDVAAATADLLGVPAVDLDDDLFDLGATSFTMIRLAQRLGESFGVDVAVDALIQAPTARRIAASLGPEPVDRRPARTDVRIALDPAAKAAFKEARVAERRLPDDLPRVPVPAAGVRDVRARYDASSFRDFAPAAVPAPDLLDLLQSVCRGELDGRDKRRYPSAGGFYPVQVYLFVRPGAVEGIGGGLYYLHPGERALVALDPAANFGPEVHVFHNRALVQGAAFGVFLVSAPAAIVPAYGQRNAERFMLIEAGHVAQLLSTEAPRRGLGLCAVGEMDFDAVRDRFGLDGDQELLLSLWGGPLSGEAARRRAELVAAEAAVPAPVATTRTGPAAPPAQRAVAVIGFAATLPGAETVEELDILLASGGSAAVSTPDERWAPLASATRVAGARVGGYLADVTEVEADEFGLSDDEAAAVDVQERLLLSVMRRCLEDAAVVPDRLTDAGPVGLYVGSMWHDHALYGVTARAQGRRGTYANRGGLAHRASHAFGLTGPSVLIDTGCVSGLAAVEAAFRAVADGRCEAAFAAGANLVLHPDHLDVLAEMGLIAEQPDSCPFTDRATGWIVGEGVGVALLKPLDRALADGDPVHAVLRGGALAHSGATRQFGVPDPARLGQVMRDAVADAGLRPEDIGYVEAAAAGAALADALEFTMVGRVFGGPEGPVPVGSVKPTTGHLEGASAFAQLAKVIAQFRRRELFPLRLTSAPNPALARVEGAVLPVEPETRRWRTPPGQPRRVLVNGIAGGGSYGSLVIEEPPRRPTAPATPTGPLVLPLSADTPQNLSRAALALAAALDRDPDLDLASVARSLREGRRARPARGAAVTDRERAASTLRALADRVRRDGAGTGEEVAAVPAAEREALAAWLAGGDPAWPALPAATARAALPAVPLTTRRIPLVPDAQPRTPDAPTGGAAGDEDAFARLARIVAVETGRPATELSETDDLFALAATSQQMLRIAVGIAADGGRELGLETLFTAADLGVLAREAYPALAAG
ncbi:amino acid adenylation domain-containing protein [Micromonospora sp. NPDC018662]|uniref:amino acid adenylation domain-containing protein n=1 Tax=Micromonospora sp. NPDC018662 TaxID=3364238 RepID=UPI0037BB59DD